MRMKYPYPTRFHMLRYLDPIRKIYVFRITYWIARVGMGLAFIISGIRKLPGIKFTALPIENPVGFYFEAMHSTGFYWNFIGYFQILIGIMAFFNRSVVLSVLLMMPVTVNIFLVSVSLNMAGTPFITSAMLLGNLWLLFWNYENYLGLLKKPSGI